LAFDGDKVVGASTAIPMKYETDQVKKPFLNMAISLMMFFIAVNPFK